MDPSELNHEAMIKKAEIIMQKGQLHLQNASEARNPIQYTGYNSEEEDIQTEKLL